MKKLFELPDNWDEIKADIELSRDVIHEIAERASFIDDEDGLSCTIYSVGEAKLLIVSDEGLGLIQIEGWEDSAFLSLSTTSTLLY